MEPKQENKECELQKDLERLENFRPIDDDFMRCLFRDNMPLAQMVLRILIQKSDLTITDIETQADMKRLVGARSICLDALGYDDQGKIYDLEIQRSDAGAGVHRARYHSSVLDVEYLRAGQDFEELPETYVIFITENDIFKKGLSLYHIDRINIDTNTPFNDGEHILYINGAYRNDDEIGRLMHDFSCKSANDMYYKDMADATRYYKETEEGRAVMCKAMEDMRNEAVWKKTVENVLRWLKMGLTHEQIAEGEDLTIEQVQKIAASRTA